MTREELAQLPWVDVASSNIARLAFLPAAKVTGDLYVEFLAGEETERPVYRYAQVPEKVYSRLAHAHSVGSVFHAAIKGRYAYERVAVESPGPDEDRGLEQEDLVGMIGRVYEEVAALRAEIDNLTRLLRGALRPQHRRRSSTSGGTQNG